MIDLGTKRELLWDDFIVDTAKTTAELRFHGATPHEEVLIHDAPWEGDGCDYHNIVYDNGVYRMYYLGWSMSGKSSRGIRVCVAQSRDGLAWSKPELGICEFEGSTKNNIILDDRTDKFDNFFVFIDDNPACPGDERHKGISLYSADRALWLYTSTDGFNFKRKRKITSEGKFDTLNTALWDKERKKYFCFIRGFHNIPENGELNKGIRDIRVLESEDFISWSEPKLLDFGEGEDYPLYTNVITKYYRAPHVFTGFPSRYVERAAWSDNFDKLCGREKRLSRMERSPRYGLAVTDCVFMSSRDAERWSRCDEAFMRPGPEHPGNWVYGSCYPATGMIETKSAVPGADNEISMYVFENHWIEIPAVLRRHTVRLDGFASYGATYKPKRLVTKPFMFDGEKLFINFSTSARGYMRLRLICGDGSISTCELFGDATDREVGFEGCGAGVFRGRPVVMEAEMSDADFYSFIFR